MPRRFVIFTFYGWTCGSGRVGFKNCTKLSGPVGSQNLDPRATLVRPIIMHPTLQLSDVRCKCIHKPYCCFSPLANKRVHLKCKTETDRKTDYIVFRTDVAVASNERTNEDVYIVGC